MNATNEFLCASNKDEAIDLVGKAKVVFVIPRFGLDEEYVKLQKTEAVRLIERSWCDEVVGGTFARLSKIQGYLYLG